MATFKISALAAVTAVGATFFSSATHAAFNAASSCAAFSGSFTDTPSSTSTPEFIALSSGLKVGDVITVNMTSIVGTVTPSADFNGNKQASLSSAASSATYTVTASDLGSTYFELNFGYSARGSNWSFGGTYSCAPGPTGGNIQANAAQAEGQNSLFAFGDMLDGVIAGTTSNSFQPLTGNSNGLGVMVAPGQHVTPTADVPAMMSESPWRMFGAGRYTGTSGQSTGGQFTGLFGTAYRLNDATAIGLFGGFETFNFSDATSSTFSGTGESIGVFAATTRGRLSLDAKAYTTFLGYTIASGGATGTTNANRFAGSLDAAYELGTGPTSFKPFIKGMGLTESDAAYTDSAATAHPALSLSEGIGAAGLRLSRAMAMSSGGTATPYVSGEADYIFGNSVLPQFGTSAGLSGKVNAGITWSLPKGVTFGLDAGYAGIGSSIGAWTGQATLAASF